MIIVDQFMKMIQLKATIMNISLEEITKIYWNKIWKIHRVPRKVLSDRESQSVSRFIEDLMKILEAKRKLSTMYHPQIDRQTKQINQEIGIFL